MRNSKFVITILLCFLAGEFVIGQTYQGSLNLNKKGKAFSLTAGAETVHVMISNKKLAFNDNNHFSILKTSRDSYTLVNKGDTIRILKKKNHIYFSTDISFVVEKTNKKTLILRDKTGRIVLDANFILKKGTADYRITVTDDLNTTGLLAFSTYYLLFHSKNLQDALNTPYIPSVY